MRISHCGGAPVVAILALTIGTFAQQSSTGVVRGLVLDADSGTPLGEVDVEVAGSTGLRGRTDAAGRYVIADVPPGGVRVSLLRVFTNEAPPSVPGVVRSNASTSMPDLHVRLPATISGRVIDDMGVPMIGSSVIAIGRQYSRSAGLGPLEDLSGRHLWYRRTSTATTDDLGRFRLEWLGAGEPHYVLALPPRHGEGAMSGAPDPLSARPVVRRATYYPFAAFLEGAVPIVLRSREERSNVEIVMPRMPARCVSATLARSGIPAGLTFSILEADVARLDESSMDGPSSLRPRLQSESHGRIRTCALHDGSFILVAGDSSEGGAAPTVRAITSFVINSGDLDLGLISAEPSVSVTATVSWDDAQNSDVQPTFGLSTTPFALSARITAIPITIEFQAFTDLPYSLRVSRLQAPLYIKDVRHRGQSILGGPFTATGGGAPVEVVVGTDAGSIAAHVRSAAGTSAVGSTVVVIMDGVEGNPVAASALVDENGTARFSGLPPRRYRLVALRTAPPAMVTNLGALVIRPSPEALTTLQAASGEQVNLGPRESVSIALIAR